MPEAADELLALVYDLGREMIVEKKLKARLRC
jgi:hypothetical protein